MYVYIMHTVCALTNYNAFISDADEFDNDDEWNNLALNLDVDTEMLLARSQQSSGSSSKRVSDLTARIHRLEEQV